MNKALMTFADVAEKLKGWILIPLLVVVLWFRFASLAEDVAVLMMRFTYWIGYPLPNHSIAMVAFGGVVSAWAFICTFSFIGECWDKGTVRLYAWAHKRDYAKREEKRAALYKQD